MNSEKLPHVEIYTDGSCRPNPGKGGWAAILRSGSHEKLLIGNHPNTTNNRMEIQAVISALQALKMPCNVDVYVDSTYLRKGITEWISRWQLKGWRLADGRDVQNADLWQNLDQLNRSHKINWHWIKGHAGNFDNERVNKLAREALDRLSEG